MLILLSLSSLRNNKAKISNQSAKKRALGGTLSEKREISRDASSSSLVSRQQQVGFATCAPSDRRKKFGGKPSVLFVVVFRRSRVH